MTTRIERKPDRAADVLRHAVGARRPQSSTAGSVNEATDSWRPSTAAQAAERGLRHGNPGAHFREFVDEFNKLDTDDARQLSLTEAPDPTGDEKLDAWYGAAAEHLCFQHGLAPPRWTQEPCRFLRRAWFPAGLDSLKALCLKESPTAFRRRMIFVDAEPLSRPRRTLMEIEQDRSREP